VRCHGGVPSRSWANSLDVISSCPPSNASEHRERTLYLLSDQEGRTHYEQFRQYKHEQMNINSMLRLTCRASFRRGEGGFVNCNYCCLVAWLSPSTQLSSLVATFEKYGSSWNCCCSSLQTSKQGRFYVRFEVLAAVAMKNCVFWDVMQRGSCKNRGFREI
jgi:hypothetical protein